jgi:cytochrome c
MRTAGCALAALSLVLLLSPGPSAAADAKVGKELFDSDCANCHTLRKSEKQKRGPHLENLFARRYASVEGFEYRMVWTKADPTWTPEQLDAYLDIHGRFESGGRADLIEYLKEATKP